MSDEQKKTMFGYAAPQMPSPAAPKQESAAAQQGTPAPQAAAPAEPAGAPKGHMPPAVGQMPPAGQEGYGHAPHDQQAHAPQYQQQPGHGMQQGQPGQHMQPGQYPHDPQAPQGYAPQHGHEQQQYQQQQYQQAPQGYGPGPGQSYPPQQGYAPQAGGVQGARTVSKGLYLGLHFGGIGIGLILLIWGINDRAVQELIPFAPIPILIGFISFYVLLHKAWASIQDGYAKTTPGKAVGFSFIPIFNLYWMFVAIGSWGTEYNNFMHRRGLQGGYQASPGLFTTHCILQILIGGAALLITMPMVIAQMCNGINSIAAGNLPHAQVRQ